MGLIWIVVSGVPSGLSAAYLPSSSRPMVILLPPGQGTVTARNHWHSWVDKIQGKSDAFVQTPFSYAAKIAEAGLLCAKASRFPGQELRWDKATLTFTNHAEATKTIVRREYRKGNVFNLRSDEDHMVQLPKTEITIDSVLAIKAGSR